MIFVFVEDGTLEVIEQFAEAQRYDSLDVESGVFVFYDADGTWLQPRFSVPEGFELVRSEVLGPTVDSFDVALGEASELKPNKHFQSLEAIRRHREKFRGT
jgi:hypothetical protein